MKRSLLLSLLLEITFTAPAQEVISKMTRDRTAGYIDELMRETRDRKTCDSCTSVFDLGGVWIHEAGIISITSSMKYPANKTRYSSSWQFDPSTIDTVLILPGENELMYIQVKFPSKTIRESKQKNYGDKYEIESALVKHLNIPFLRGDGKNADRIREAFLHLKELSIKEKNSGQ
jgi:hypothetical protein